ncbi:MAG: hypothetical protein IPI53_10710 [Saprospiraceae bacterium]|nr:hypothetical protein [Saprospiraceae bacterium]
MGRDPNNHGNIGEDAVDLSLSSIVSATNGATGAASIAMGQQTLASGNSATAFGQGTRALGHLSIAMGNGTTARDFMQFNGYGYLQQELRSIRLRAKFWHSKALILPWEEIQLQILSSVTSDSLATRYQTDPLFIIAIGRTFITRKMQSLS